MANTLTLVHDPDCPSVEGLALVRMLTAQGIRPNILATCAAATAGALTRFLLQSCAPPLYTCMLPGVFELPDLRSGTLVLERVEALTLGQQITLYDWLTADRGSLQVVSVATTELEELVQDGRFLEGLFYRLNVVRLDSSELGR